MSEKVNLDPELINTIFEHCKFKPYYNNISDVAPFFQCFSIVWIKGIFSEVSFNSVRLNIHKITIEAMLNELPKEFRKRVSLLLPDVCNNKYGNKWTDSCKCAEELLLLGAGIGKVKILSKDKSDLLHIVIS